MVATAQNLALMHGNDWSGQNVAGWFASEKLDGWRIRWDGERLMTRNGAALDAPVWFTSRLPNLEIDLELHLGRGFNHNYVKRAVAAGDWARLKLTAFDVPSMSFQGAIEYLQSCDFDAVEFSVVRSTAAAFAMRDDVIAAGGEGIMLRKPGTPYTFGRVDYLLKLKA